MDLENLFENDVFNVLSDERKEAFKELAKKIEGKNQLEMMGIIMDFQRTMPKNDKKLTKEENTAMIYCLMEAMPTQDKKKFSEIICLLERMGQNISTP